MMKENRIMEISAFMDDKEYNVALAGVSGCFTEKLFFWSLVESYSDGWPSETVFHLHTGFLVAARQTLSRLPLWWSALSTSVFFFRTMKETALVKYFIVFFTFGTRQKQQNSADEKWLHCESVKTSVLLWCKDTSAPSARLCALREREVLLSPRVLTLNRAAFLTTGLCAWTF